MVMPYIFFKNVSVWICYQFLVRRMYMLLNWSMQIDHKDQACLMSRFFQLNHYLNALFQGVMKYLAVDMLSCWWSSLSFSPLIGSQWLLLPGSCA